MSKYDYEIAGELTQEFVKAVGVALSGGDTSTAAVKAVLTPEGVAAAYKTILTAVRQGIGSN